MVTHSITSSRVLYLVAGNAALFVAVFAALYYTANNTACSSFRKAVSSPPWLKFCYNFATVNEFFAGKRTTTGIKNPRGC
jgi:hypothetical protein